MKIQDRVVIVTGGGHGIGEGLCRRFADDGAKGVVAADVDPERANAVAGDIGGLAVQCDVTIEADIQSLVFATIERYGPVDVFCSNAGGGGRDYTSPDEGWSLAWQLNVMAHVYAARAVVPSMMKRGGGYLVNTASLVDSSPDPGPAGYTVAKHAAIGFAEWMAINYGHLGIKVGVICPQFVNTMGLTSRDDDSKLGVQTTAALKAIGTMLIPADVAEAVVQAMDDERFMILPNPEVGEYFQRKASDDERWLRGMLRMMERSRAAAANADAS